ncbi:MAG: type II toxin-antitoxin system mRNA interferase toxin, RelE/StbE family [Candidatus Omnitrophica bacterium CG11_big_fil_rev_8_21_14_0_20_45_26]|uniref:Type II toxin-antitoxin system mRNA interferase toxin, RelE/StbE family n=1 Tax=Candidatus Abzuiibacterium crystallinum TaxID=1974748 RepID=A0A2H0LNK3_9BACT|nr:MAG: type II toxin-antitoxin system mRNA interferase toxin, RelE/StbE family [Candidatus Omnitrophica bacterium CG11_big_fil_rev_8_21_14_0_20_45_26]PIW64770.1 MAG: type II toxin-antitoxin system mRNA interferase toxin, RelE/StbE family [Candidatus Omnitrophica bacterium CG12_big_fil_rev_8_21_14_0_65_45_16]
MTRRTFEIRITRRAEKDIHKLTPKLKQKLFDILTEVIAIDPYQGKRLLGDLEGSYAYRLTFQDRIVYSIDEEKKIVYIERARTHYGE